MEIVPSPTCQAACALLGRWVTITVDRPMGSRHPRWEWAYALNYGEIPEIRAADGGGLDAYVVDVGVPVDSVHGRVIAVLERLTDDDPKLIVAHDGVIRDVPVLETAVAFGENYFPLRRWYLAR